MHQLRMPREYYLKRAVESYERAGDPRSAAEVLAHFGTPTTSVDAARRFVALGDLPAAGEAYLAAGELRAALDCFTRARLPERMLVCLEQLGDTAASGALLLELGRAAAAAALLEQALAVASEPVAQVTLRFQLAQALGVATGESHYRAALAQVEQLPETVASAAAWAALGAWGVARDRQDRTQEGYAEALRLLATAQDWPRWREVATRYRAAAQAMGNRRLVQILSAELAERAPAEEPETPPPDPMVALLEAARWDEALDALEPRAREGDEAAKGLLVAMVEGLSRAGIAIKLSSPAAAGRERGPGGAGHPSVPPLDRRRQAAALLGEVGDPRLLDPRTGDAPLGGYWCPIEAGPFWYGDDQQGTLREMTLPYTYRIARYVVTNAEYRRFIEAGGYQERRWWTDNGWTYLQRGGDRFPGDPARITLPRHWDNAERNQPNQPVVGVSWYEAAAYCRWLSEVGRNAGWLPSTNEIRLPTSLEWERAARGIDQRRYPWGDEPPDPERANNKDTGIGFPTAVGCFPAGAAACGAMDMAANVMEWMSTPYLQRDHVAARKDFTPYEGVLLSGGWYGGGLERINCGARYWYLPFIRYLNRSYRVLWSRALLE